MGNTSISLAALSLIALACTAADARAADPDWSGFHVGLGIAQTRGDVDTEAALGGQWNGYPGTAQAADALNADGSLSGSGAGIQFGYDHQFADRWVVGVAVDYTQAGAESAVTRTAAYPGGGEEAPSTIRAASTVELGRAYAIRSRIGYATGRMLWYATAGYASSSADVRTTLDYSVPLTDSAFGKRGSASITSRGLVWGAGVDWRFAQHWDAGLRYTRSSGGDSADYTLTTVSRSGQFTVQPPEAFAERVAQRIDHDSIALTVNHRF